MPEDTSHLIDDICSSAPARVKAGLQAVAPHRDTLAPALCARLAQACVEPDRWTGGEGDPSPTFLLFVAAAWKLTEAHPLVVALLRLPPEQCNDVLGDFITEGARQVLADTYPGNLLAIEALALDARAEPFARGAALNAAALLAVRGAISRATVVDLLTRCAALPLDPANEDDSTFAGQIVSTALDLRATELRDAITRLFEADLVDPTFCGDLEEVLAELDGASDDWRFPPPIADAWEAVRRWHFFSPGYATAKTRAEKKPLPAPTSFDFEPKTIRRETPKIGRNDPCPCGSGKKYKKCCGA